MKASRIVTILILVAIIVALIVGASSLDSIVKKEVETLGPQITKVSVSLESVHIVLFNGSAKLTGLVIGNPEGYKAPQAISLGVVETGVSPFSILSDKIVVRTMHIIDPEISFEGGLAGNNLGKIIENINAYKKTGAKNPTSTGTTTPSGPGKKIEVDDFLITGAKAHVRLTDLGGKEMTLSLPEIHLANLGTSNDGLTPADLAQQILKAISAATLKAVSSDPSGFGSLIPENLGKEATQGADQIKKGMGGLIGK